MYKICIVDDEHSCIDQLSEYIKKFFNDECEYSIDSYTSSTKFLNEYKAGYDILFLDILMPGMNGMDTAKRIRKIDGLVTICFITSISKFAVEGYEVNASDYILKPCSYEDFSSRFSRIKQKIDNSINKDKKIILKQKDGFNIIDEQDIIYVESDGHYMNYHTNNEVIKYRETFKETLEKLDKTSFDSCNKGYIVNFKYVEKVDNLYVYLTNNEKLQISRLKKKAFLSALSSYYFR